MIIFVKGELIAVGSDALPPDAVHQFYRFPDCIQLQQKALQANGKALSLQSGMSVGLASSPTPRQTLAVKRSALLAATAFQPPAQCPF